MQSEAKTVAEYLESLPEDRRASISAVRDTILVSLPDGYEETMNWGMICYQVPLEIHPETYNGLPLMYAALASQKNHMAVYLTGVYMSEDTRAEFEREYQATGKRMDMGKSCVRFRKLEDLPLDLVGRCIAELEVAEFCTRYEEIHSARATKARPRRKR